MHKIRIFAVKFKKIFSLNMYRTHTCGELRIENVGQSVTLAGWVQRVRKMGGMTFVDLRDRYGITQLVFNSETNQELNERANKLGREYVIQIVGTVNERYSKNANIPTGDIEIIVNELNQLNASEVPPFTIEDQSDGGAGCASRCATTSPTSVSSRWKHRCSLVPLLRVLATSWCLPV